MSGVVSVRPNGRRRDRRDALGRIFVDTPRWREAEPRLNDLPELGWTPDYCMGLLLLGPSRSGKTSMAKEWARRMAERAALNGGTFKTVCLDVPSQANLMALATETLGALGDPDPSHGSKYEKTTRVVEAVERLGVDLLMFDEIQRLVDEKGKLRAEAANWLTGLLNKRVCPLLFVGEPHASTVFQQRYLSGRTLGEIQITPFDWADRDDRRAWREVMYALSENLSMPEKSELHDIDTALRIHSHSDGLLGVATRLLEFARSDARRRGLPKLTHEVLADAVDRLGIGEEKRRPNPFRVATPVPGAIGHVVPTRRHSFNVSSVP